MHQNSEFIYWNWDFFFSEYETKKLLHNCITILSYIILSYLNLSCNLIIYSYPTISFSSYLFNFLDNKSNKYELNDLQNGKLGGKTTDQIIESAY